MTFPRCPYCKEPFTRSRYRPDQKVCGARDCQRRRKADYHRRKIQNDSIYRVQCRESQQHWREQHPEYMRLYRQTRIPALPKTRPERPKNLVRLLQHAKNSVAIDLKAYSVSVFLVGPGEQVKNILANAKLILITGLSNDQESPTSL